MSRALHQVRVRTVRTQAVNWRGAEHCHIHVRAMPAQCIGRVGVGDGPTSGRFV
jgi:hypothetical protein